jgi:uncharacterized damage-inducible protein DinB
MSRKKTEGINDAPFENFTNVTAITEYSESVEKETTQYLISLTQERLNSMFKFKDGDGKTRCHRIEDMFLLLVEEEIHHCGELFCIAW